MRASSTPNCKPPPNGAPRGRARVRPSLSSPVKDNFFFDGDKRELEGRRAVMRLRFYDTDQKATITVKVRLAVYTGWGREQWAALGSLGVAGHLGGVGRAAAGDRAQRA